MTENEMNLRAALYTFNEGDGTVPPKAVSFNPMKNDNDFFLMLAAGRITFELGDENKIVASDPVRRREELIVGGDVAGAARRAAMKVAVDCIIEAPEARFLAAHGIRAELTPLPSGTNVKVR